MADLLVRLEKRPVFTAVALTLLSVLSSFLIYKTGIVAGLAVLFILVSVATIVIFVGNYRTGFYLALLFTFFMFHISRTLPEGLRDFPLGAVVEALLALVAFSILIHTIPGDDRLEPGMYKNPVAYAVGAYIVYYILMLFHPASSSVTGRLFAIREIYALGVSFFIVVHFFKTRDDIELFTKFWVFLALLAALYGLFQEFFGLQKWEMDWIYLNPEHAKLVMVAGSIRKWSFLSDINAFGLFMAYSAIVCLIMALGPFSLIRRAWLAGCGLAMMISMTFSGTRTATAMVVFGVLFFTFMTLHQRRTLMFAIAFTMGLLAILFGPFYGGTFSRIRSTFAISQDESMGVRDMTRLRMQPYARTHPIGGGLNTTGKLGVKYEPGHELAGHWDPDSGYLKTALERGWIGLLVQMGFYVTVLIFGIVQYFRTEDRWKQTYYCAYLAGFFALAIANYTQDSMDQKPVNIVLVSSFAILIRLSLLKDEAPKPKEEGLVTSSH